MTPPAPQPAGLLRRLAAAVYDGLLLAGLLMLASALWLPITGGEAVQRGTPLFLLFQLYLLLVCFAFFAWFWTHGGQTLGMRAWRLKLVTCDGGPIGLARALGRLGAAIVSAVPAGIGFWWALFDRERACLHDGWAGTRVLYEKPPEKKRRGKRKREETAGTAPQSSG